jgi:hypothetical protein
MEFTFPEVSKHSDPWRILKERKLEFLHEKILIVFLVGMA